MKRTPITEFEIALDKLATAARAFTMGESWATLDILRGYAVAYSAAQIRRSDDNPDLARGGSVASYLEALAASMEKPAPVVDMVFPDPVTEDDEHMTRAEFLAATECNALTDYDGYGHLATATTVSRIVIEASQAHFYRWPEWATHVVWYNK